MQNLVVVSDTVRAHVGGPKLFGDAGVRTWRSKKNQNDAATRTSKKSDDVSQYRHWTDRLNYALEHTILISTPVTVFTVRAVEHNFNVIIIIIIIIIIRHLCPATPEEDV